MTTPTYLQPINASASPEVQMNENALTLEAFSVYGKNSATSSGLTWGYWGGRWGGFAIDSGTLALTGGGSPTPTNYIVVAKSSGAISVSTSNANWNNTADYARVYKITTTATGVETVEDHRAGANGLFDTGASGDVSGPSSAVDGGFALFDGTSGKLLKDGGDRATANVGYLNVPQNSKSAAYTTVLSDAGKHILHPSADTTARTFTIDSNANVAYPIGSAITFVNQDSAGVVTIAITSDTMRLAGAGTTGSRTLAANGIATALKVTSTEWIISGTGLT